jgi:histone H2A|tara:strand:- start:6016 stop:6237 length:222 start_codon:yes stop_codon:yes gene_type:complete
MSGKGAKGLSGKGLSGKGAKGTMSSKKGDKRKPTSRSVKAGLQFPVGRIHRFLKVNNSEIDPMRRVPRWRRAE